MFFGELKERWPSVTGYVFSNKPCDKGFKDIIYSDSVSFTEQYTHGLQQVSEDYVLTLNEDYILYDSILGSSFFSRLLDKMKQHELDFVRLQKGESYGTRSVPGEVSLFYVDNSSPDLYSQTPTIWNKDKLLKVHTEGPKLGIGEDNPEKMFEPNASNICRTLGIKGCYVYNGEPKRGTAHYDSLILPCILSALVKGKWNISEYSDELPPILEKYNINPAVRGQR